MRFVVQPWQMRAVAALLLAALAFGGWTAFGSDPAAADYDARVAAICRSAYLQLPIVAGTYFDAVTFVDSRKLAGLSHLHPGDDRRHLHTGLLARERALLAMATTGRQELARGDRPAMVATFHVMRRRQAELGRLYGQLGIHGCAR